MEQKLLGEVITLRILLVGMSNVGKTSLVYKFTEDNECCGKSITKPTIGVDFHHKTFMTSQGHKVKLLIWDMSGEEDFRTITRTFYSEAMMILAVFSLTNLYSLLHLDTWFADIEKYAPRKMPRILVGNNITKTEKKLVMPESISVFADKHNLLYYETSCDDYHGISNMFDAVCNMLITQSLCDKIKQNDSVITKSSCVTF